MKPFLGILNILLIALCVVAYVRIAHGAGAFGRSLDVWRELPRKASSRLIAFLWLLVFVVDLVQTKSDANLTAALRLDFTPIIHQLEGSLPAAVQSLAWPPLTVLLAIAYLILFPGLLFGSAHVFDRAGDERNALMVGLVYAINYLVCLPFYVLFPVLEPWSFPGSGVLPLSDLHVHPWLMDLVRPMSGIDNCFPSYHTSLTVSLVILARDAGPKPFARAATWSGALVIASTVYLGFHWVLDVVFGVIAGVVCHGLARRVVETSLARSLLSSTSFADAPGSNPRL